MSAPGTSYKWNRTALALWELDYFTEHHVLKFIYLVTCVRLSFLKPDRIPLCGCTTLCLSIHLPVDCIPIVE